VDEWMTDRAFAEGASSVTVPGVDGSRSLAMEAGGTRATFAAWALQPLPVLVPWALGSLALALGLLTAALLVALAAGPGENEYVPVFADHAAGSAEVLRIFIRNAAVLLMYLLVALAVYVVTRPGRYAPEVRRGVLWTVGALAAYSLVSQAWRLGHDLAGAAATLDLTPAALLARACVHAVPELAAVYLPLAACLALVRRGRTDDLGAAALLCAAVALPVVFFCAGVEVHLTPYVM
jgi:hypothetical protein